MAVENGELTTLSGTQLGANATVVCDEGYVVNGSGDITCQEAGWSKSPSCVLQGKYFPFHVATYNGFQIWYKVLKNTYMDEHV